MSYVFWFLAASNVFFAAGYGYMYCRGDKTVEFSTFTLVFIYLTIAVLFGGLAIR